MFYNCKHEEGGHHGIQAKFEKISVDSIEYNVSTEEALKEVEKVLVNVPESELKVYVPTRSNQIKSFPCSNCHTQPLNELKAETGKDKKAHWNIKLAHASADVQECTTCHDQDNLDQLTTIAGNPLSIDHSYELCAQCHFKQKADWLGGAHGKRLGGWAPPKAIMTCVDCHNPHAPAFASRWPARLNTEKIRQQSTN